MSRGTERIPHEVLRQVAADEPLDEALQRLEWDDILHECRVARLQGALLLAVEEGRLSASVAQRAELLDLVAATMESVVCLEATAIGLVTSLRDVGIEVRALKGLAAAVLDSPVPWARPYSDIDLLIRPEQLYDAYVLLESAGFVRRFKEHAAGFDERFGKGNEFVAPDGWVIDVHRTFTFGALGQSVGLDDLWHGGESFDLGGTEVVALSREARFLHACVHAVASDRPPKWATLRDLAALMRSSLDPERVVELVDRWSYRAVLMAGIDEVRRRMGVEPTPEAVARWTALRPRTLDRAILGVYRSPLTGYRLRSLTGVVAAGGPRSSMTFLLGLAGRRPVNPRPTVADSSRMTVS